RPQEPVAGPKDAAAETPKAPPPVVAWNDLEAKAAIDAFAKALKGTPSLADKSNALEALARGSNKLLVRPLGTLIESDKSIVVRITLHKEKQAVDLLLKNIDEPQPTNVVELANPPAAYWEARWKAWKAWRARVKDALFALTGQRFSTASEARAWLQKNPLR